MFSFDTKSQVAGLLTTESKSYWKYFCWIWSEFSNSTFHNQHQSMSTSRLVRIHKNTKIISQWIFHYYLLLFLSTRLLQSTRNCYCTRLLLSARCCCFSLPGACYYYRIARLFSLPGTATSVHHHYYYRITRLVHLPRLLLY